MTNLERPSLVVFDLDDTLYDYRERNNVASQAMIRAICAHANLHELSVIEALEKSRATVKARLGKTGSSHSRLLYISETFRRLNLPPNTDQLIALEELFWATFLSDIQLYPGVEDLLTSLVDEGIPLALVTDLTSNIQYRKMNKLVLNGKFTFVLTSEEAGGDKPTDKPFEILNSEMSSYLQNVWFFGDSDFDIPRGTVYQTTFFKKVRKLGLSVTECGFEFADYSSLADIPLI
jgi:putative hydrolase of the HAD superfamily